MKCPACSRPLRPQTLERGLRAQHCFACGGNWISVKAYRSWWLHHQVNLPEKAAIELVQELPAEPPYPLHCPECDYLMSRARVGHGIQFTLDRCRNCGGIWLDGREWEALRRRNLHDDLHLIFSAEWQSELSAEEEKLREERELEEELGDDYARLLEVRSWLDQHPKRSLLFQLLGVEDEAIPPRRRTR